MTTQYVIDGLFLTQTVTGIQRVAFEITKALDKIVQDNELIILAPNTELHAIDLNNIPIIKYGKNKGIAWEQIDYAYYLRKHRYKALCLTNVLPLLYMHGAIMIHDVSYKANPQFFSNKRDRLSALWHRLNYYAASKSSMDILTVSNFSKAEMLRYYHMDESKVNVIYNAWQHMQHVQSAEDTFDRYPELIGKDYYFSMASLAPNKNFNWILEAAKHNPSVIFAIAGGGKMDNKGVENVRLLGYVTDEDARTLMANCKAFIFPTFYEGFGLPPLEAISCGCNKIIVSDTACMHEIYGEHANYIDPFDSSKWIISDARKSAQDLLRQFSWSESAKKMADILMI